MISSNIELATCSYPVRIGAGASAELPALLKALAPTQIVVIADAHVAALHADRLLEQARVGAAALITFPTGEASKSLSTCAELYGQLAARQLDRGGVIVTFGGGVAGDLGGFVAATWLRGVRYVQAPTSLEAAVDASVGGKTGVNHAAGKNLIGAFHQPSAVVIDTDFLRTLSDRDVSAGLAESVKHAAIRDAEFLAWQEARADAILRREADTLAELILRNVRIKADVVRQDEREAGLRAILNYGHTIGHAVEHVLQYDLRHGECVSLGMIAENELAVGRGRLSRSSADRVRALLARFGLPERLPRAVPPEAFVQACRQDKKATGGALRLALLREIGSAEIAEGVSEGELLRAAAAIGLSPA